MTRILGPLAALAALIPFVSAGIKFTSPAAGKKLTAGESITIAWTESGDGPKITDLLSYQLFVYAGGNTEAEMVLVAPITAQGLFTAGNQASGLVGVATAGDTTVNAFFVKMIAVGKAGGQLVTYSDRFAYTGMKGTFDPVVKAAIAKVDGKVSPKGEDSIVDPADPAATAPVAGDFGMDYTMQTGPTRYAPMQPIPPKTITAKDTKPLYPTSSVSIAKTILPIPKVQTTLTQSQTFSVESKVNTVAPAAHPTDDMAKFLNRWKD